MSSFWPTDDGWPYPDTGDEVIDLDAESDDDLLSLTTPSTHVFDDLEPIERQVITEHYGLGGVAPRTMRQLHDETGLSRADLRHVLGSGLGKLRSHLQA